MGQYKQLAAVPVAIGIAAAYLVGVAFIAVPIMLLWAWALTLLWGWFIVAIFGLPSLSYAQALGMSIVVGFFKTPNHVKDEYQNSAWNKLAVQIIHPITSVGIGWIIQRWM